MRKNNYITMGVCLFIILLFQSALISFAKDNPSENTELFKSFNDIEDMKKEVNQAFEKHKQVFQNTDYMRYYYINAGIPGSEIGKSVLKLDEKGFILDYPEWLNHNLAEVSDISFGGPTIPGLSTVNGAAMRIDNMNSRLNESLDFLRDNSDWYLEHPPKKEMAQLNKMMSQWRDIVKKYHQALHNYLSDTASWIKFKKYYSSVVYNEKREALDKKYPDRSNNKVQQAKYEVEKKQLDKEYTEEEEKAKAPRDRMSNKGWDDVIAPRYMLLENDLRTDFEEQVDFLKSNALYSRKWARLKELEPGSEEAKNLKEELKELGKQLKEEKRRQQKEYGRDWKDRYRDPETGELPEGSPYLEDTIFDEAKKLMKKDEQSKKGTKNREAKEETKDPFYDFLEKSRKEDEKIKQQKEKKSLIKSVGSAIEEKGGIGGLVEDSAKEDEKPQENKEKKSLIKNIGSAIEEKGGIGGLVDSTNESSPGTEEASGEDNLPWASSRDPETGITTTSKGNPDGSRTITKTDEEGNIISEETIPGSASIEKKAPSDAGVEKKESHETEKVSMSKEQKHLYDTYKDLKQKKNEGTLKDEDFLEQYKIISDKDNQPVEVEMSGEQRKEFEEFIKNPYKNINGLQADDNNDQKGSETGTAVSKLDKFLEAKQE